MKKILIYGFVMLLIISVVYSANGELNFSKESKDHLESSAAIANLKIESIRQDPLPANPGEYTDLYIKVWNTGGETENMRFEFTPSYPLEIYPITDSNKTFSNIAAGEKLTLHYKIKIDGSGIAGDYEAQFKAYVGDKAFYPFYFNINVDDVTTTFDVALQEVTKDGASIALSNTGKNPANSITIKLENQTDFNILGSNSYIIGNLNNGDYTILNLLIAPKEGKTQPTLNLQIDYTDTIGNRRSVTKELNIPLNANTEKGFNELTGFVTADNQANTKNSNFFKYLSIVLVIVIVCLIFYRRRKSKEE